MAAGVDCFRAAGMATGPEGVEEAVELNDSASRSSGTGGSSPVGSFGLGSVVAVAAWVVGGLVFAGAAAATGGDAADVVLASLGTHGVPQLAQKTLPAMVIRFLLSQSGH